MYLSLNDNDGDHVLLPYNNTGKQYVLTRCTANISSFAVPRTDMMLLKLLKKFLRAMDGSVELVLLLIDTLRYLTFSVTGIVIPFSTTEK